MLYNNFVVNNKIILTEESTSTVIQTNRIDFIYFAKKKAQKNDIAFKDVDSTIKQEYTLRLFTKIRSYIYEIVSDFISKDDIIDDIHAITLREYAPYESRKHGEANNYFWTSKIKYIK